MNYRTLNYDHLQELGINPLTGEACAFSMRLLCDLNEDGVRLLQDFFGLLPADPNAIFPTRMNSSVGDKPSVASCMLVRSMFNDLYKFVLMLEGWDVVVQYGNDWTGMTGEHYEKYKDHYPGTINVFTNWRGCGNQPYRGSRNIHAMTGRSI